ncbi:peroxidasin [Oryzias melastigma]|nr:peroxidasin [Oryzias melastigma]XP_024137609.1 peroxidasin [Oryzias melastigma]
MLFHWGLLLGLVWVEHMTLADGCVCPNATILPQIPSELAAAGGGCCVNYSGSAFSHVLWSVFSNHTNIEILDLSNCNISFIHSQGKVPSSLQKVYLDGNRLTVLPRNFLASQPNLTEVNLSKNLLQELPEGFLQDSNRLQRLYLQANQLRSLPEDVLQLPHLQRLELDGNQWDCSCLLLEGLSVGGQTNRTSALQDLMGNLTCSSPWQVAGKMVWSLRQHDMCRPASLTALFIVLPLVILSALLLCWCCGRKRKKKKEAPVFGSSKKRALASSSHVQKHLTKQQPLAGERRNDGDCSKQGILKNHQPSDQTPTLLDSSKDIYEEVEIKVGSVESLPHCSSFTEGKQGSQGPDGAAQTQLELDTVSVTEVLKDSADREKAYMTQSTEYYSLVPGIELEDSDHAEYENVVPPDTVLKEPSIV